MSCASLGQSLFEPTTALDLSWKIGSSSGLKCDELDGGTLGDPGLFAKSEDMNFALLGCFQLRGMGSPAFLADIVHDSLLERRSSLAVSHAMTQISVPCTLSADCIPAKTIAAARSTRLSHSPSKRSVSMHGACATSSVPPALDQNSPAGSTSSTQSARRGTMSILGAIGRPSDSAPLGSAKFAPGRHHSSPDSSMDHALGSASSSQAQDFEAPGSGSQDGSISGWRTFSV